MHTAVAAAPMDRPAAACGLLSLLRRAGGALLVLAGLLAPGVSPAQEAVPQPSAAGSVAEANLPVDPPAEVDDGLQAPLLEALDPEEFSRWHLGPVSYLLSGPETRLFKKLGSPLERRAFIKQFWLRRDPKVETIENEYRFDFWKRVLEANQLFTRTSEPGWKTDRGKYYILLGPPDSIESTNMPNRRGGVMFRATTESGATVTRVFGADKPSESFLGLERWTYRSRPADRLPPNFILAFRLTSAGNYELSSDPRDWTLFQGSYSEMVGALDQPQAFGLGDPSPDADFLQLYSDAAVALDLGRINRVPEPSELLTEVVTSEEFFGVIPLLLQTDYYMTENDSTLAVFTVGVHRASFVREHGDAALDRLLVVGKLESLERPGRMVHLAGADELSAAPDDGDDLLLFQTVKALRPGSYNATFGILDREENRIGSQRERIRVPDYRGAGLTLSTLSLARTLLPLTEEERGNGLGSAAGRSKNDVPPVSAFRMGSFKVIPKTEPRFRNGEEFSIYYQVYGARPDPLSGTPRLNISYRFFILKDGGFKPIGKPIRMKDRTQAVQGWSFPIRNWPEATFRLEVTVEDILGGDVAVGQTVFGVAPS